jgi:hypothetical protein
MTPLVPASWPEERAASAVSTAMSTETADVTASPQSTTSISPSSAAEHEHAFWNATPQYSVAPPLLLTDPPRPRPSRVRASLTRVLFVAVAGFVVALLYYEASIVYHVPWRNPRLLLDRVRLA